VAQTKDSGYDVGKRPPLLPPRKNHLNMTGGGLFVMTTLGAVTSHLGCRIETRQ